MNRFQSWAVSLILGCTLIWGASVSIDTDRRVIPVLEKLKLFLYDVMAQDAAETHGTFDAVVLIYNGGSHGTGFFISDKQLLTNHHMVAKSDPFFGRPLPETHEEVTIQLRDGSQHQARVIKSNPDIDIALIEVIGDFKAPKTLALAKEMPGDGTTIYIAGNGGTDFWWAKGGYLRGTYKYSTLWKNTQSLSHIKSKGGFSGSPVVRMSTGEVIGVHAGGYTSTDIGISVPLHDVHTFLAESPKDTNKHLKFTFDSSEMEQFGYTALYVEYDLITEDMKEPLAEFCKKTGITVEVEESGARVIFLGPKPALLRVSDYIIKDIPLT